MRGRSEEHDGDEEELHVAVGLLSKVERETVGGGTGRRCEGRQVR